MDWLKKLLEQHGVDAELIGKILGDTKDNQYIPKQRFDEVNEAKKQLETDLKERDEQLKELGEKAKGNEELTAKITELQEANKKATGDYEAMIRNITLDNAIKLKLKDNKAKYEDLLMSKFDREKLKVKDDGTIEGLDEQLSTIKEGYKDLFEQPISGEKPNLGSGSSGPGTKKFGEDIATQRNAETKNPYESLWK